jgi:hypothetical protein
MWARLFRKKVSNLLIFVGFWPRNRLFCIVEIAKCQFLTTFEALRRVLPRPRFLRNLRCAVQSRSPRPIFVPIAPRSRFRSAPRGAKRARTSILWAIWGSNEAQTSFRRLNSGHTEAWSDSPRPQKPTPRGDSYKNSAWRPTLRYESKVSELADGVVHI